MLAMLKGLNATFKEVSFFDSPDSAPLHVVGNHLTKNKYQKWLFFFQFWKEVLWSQIWRVRGLWDQFKATVINCSHSNDRHVSWNIVPMKQHT